MNLMSISIDLGKMKVATIINRRLIMKKEQEIKYFVQTS